MTVRLLDTPQGSPLWHAIRRTRYGASELGAIAGVSPYRRQGQVWSTKLHGIEPEAPELWQLVGHALEPLTLRQWAIEHNTTTQPGRVIVEDRGWRLCSTDGHAANEEPIDGKVRFRGAPDWDHWTEGTIPGDVALQLQQQADLTETLIGHRLEAAHIAAILVDAYGVTYRSYRLELTPERRDQYADIWRPYPGRWHASYVLPRVAPPDVKTEDIAVLVEPTKTVRREATPDELALVAQLVEAEQHRKAAARVAREATEARDGIRDQILRYIGPDTTIPGITWKPHGEHVRLTLEKT